MKNKTKKSKAVYAVLFVSIMMLISLAGCSNKTDENKLLGTWVLYGVVENSENDPVDKEYSIDDALVGEDFMIEYGVDFLMETVINVTEEGVGEWDENIPGARLDSVNNISDKQMVQRVELTAIDGKYLAQPQYMDIYFTLNDGYLFVKTVFSDSELSGGDVNVFKRRK